MKNQRFKVEQTFNDFLDELQYAKNKSPKTIRAYRQSYNRLKPFIVDSSLDIEQFRDQFSKGVILLAKTTTLAKTSINVIIRSLNSFLGWLSENGFNKANIRIKKVPLMKADDTVIEVVTDGDIKLLLDYKPPTLNQRRAWMAAILSMDTGLRLSEMLSMKPSDVDFTSDVITVTGKGSKQRRVAFSGVVRVHLYKFIRDVTKGGQYVFCTSDGKRMQDGNFDRDLRIMLRAAKTSKVYGYHTFRHTFGTAYIKNGGEIAKLQRLMGHSDIRTTMLYVHNQIEDLKKDYDSRSPIAVSAKRYAVNPKSKKLFALLEQAKAMNLVTDSDLDEMLTEDTNSVD